ncbi:hypothetical protein ATANTOWER_006654 [Ataeniobius toweri]|uniref:Uncharacterized protein n=1 Tax=Ataeniobius toweri TaxID=208326 RepID=A0ABU7BR98_9TELE|nr:hypothetical protein [Ataeniobius toweri]
MVLGAPLNYTADCTGPEQMQCKSRVTVNTAPSQTTGGEVSSMEQQQQTQGMIQDLKTLPGVIVFKLYIRIFIQSNLNILHAHIINLILIIIIIFWDYYC